ncbi:site-specific DNA-methyltransferase [Candidatus Gracilibacteria bacterium]|nr:site-specific DNA-methyltransferase [Candidatus Gracilibacteria bacterium]
MLAHTTLICGDAATTLATLPPTSVDLLIADPPYNLGKDYGVTRDRRSRSEYRDFTLKWLHEAVRVLKPNGSIYVFMGVRYIAELYTLLEDECGFLFNSWVTWHYTQGMGRTRGFSPRHEDILYFTCSADYTFNIDAVRVPQKYYRRRNNMAGANPGDVWQFSHVHYCSAERQPHPTQKPEALLARIIAASSQPGDLVLDPFVGSGTSCRVAQILKRRSIGIDINPAYIDLSRERLAAPFSGFDSADPRAERVPRDRPT